MVAAAMLLSSPATARANRARSRPIVRAASLEGSTVRPGWRILLVLALLTGALAFAARATGAQPAGAGASAADPWAHEYLAGELLVQFRAEGLEALTTGASPLTSAPFAEYLSAFGVAEALPGVGDGRTYRLRFAGAADLREKQAALARDPHVAFAEPNYLLTTQLTPNDGRYAEQKWALESVGADRAWDITTGTSGAPVTIALLDTGISPTHPDLAGRLVAGYDFVGDDTDARDDNGHGTFTAGIAGATGNNAIGVAGLSWGAKLMPIKILDQDGRGPVSAFAQGIRYAVDNKATIVNVSAGIPVPSQTMEAAVAYALGAGVPVIAASGNKADGVPNYPAAYPDVIAVAASTKSDTIADFSSYGSYVWLAAPGSNIVSTYSRDGDTYAMLSGTSASTPFVSGTIALMRAQRPDLSLKAIREILKVTAVDILDAGFDQKSGNGRLDAFRALLLASEPAPTLPAAAVTPASGKGTEPFMLNAAGFAPNEPVTAWVTAADGTYRFKRYPTLYASATGLVATSFNNADPLPVGAQKVTLYGETSKKVAAAQFSVTQSVNAAFTRVAPIPDGESKVYFAESGHTLGGPFLQYWRANGGLSLFGYPISEEFTETSPADGKPYTVQYFERNRFELHPENKGTPFEVLLGLLGRDLTAGKTFSQVLMPFDSTEERVYFPETRHSLSAEFLRYWRANGGLAQFGYPISEPFQEVSPTDGKTYLVQYFERNRFELHPENPQPHNVLLGLLGTDSAKRQGYIR
jgi:subtilisin family serine protease